MSVVTVPAGELQSPFLQGLKLLQDNLKCSPLTPLLLVSVPSSDHESSCDESDHQGVMLAHDQLAASGQPLR